MKKTNLIVFAIGVLIFTGCSKDDGNAAVDKDGLCTEATVNAYNDISIKGGYLSTYSSEYTLQSVQNACSSFKSLIGGRSCKAKNLTSGSEMYINSNSQYAICERANQLMISRTNENRVQPSPGYNTPDITNTPNGGMCSYAVEYFYKDVIKQAKIVDYTSTWTSLQEGKANCYNFKILVSGTCQIDQGGTKVAINKNSLDNQCSKFQELQMFQVKYPNILSQGDLNLASSQSKIRMILLDVAALHSTDVSLYGYQDGKSFEFGLRGSWDQTKPYCVFVSTKTDRKNLETEFKFDQISVTEQPTYLKISSSEMADSFSEISCYGSKTREAKNLSLDDLRNAFKGIFAIELVK